MLRWNPKDIAASIWAHLCHAGDTTLSARCQQYPNGPQVASSPCVCTLTISKLVILSIWHHFKVSMTSLMSDVVGALILHGILSSYPCVCWVRYFSWAIVSWLSYYENDNTSAIVSFVWWLLLYLDCGLIKTVDKFLLGRYGSLIMRLIILLAPQRHFAIIMQSSSSLPHSRGSRCASLPARIRE